jgi:hypothetical protein
MHVQTAAWFAYSQDFSHEAKSKKWWLSTTSLPLNCQAILLLLVQACFDEESERTGKKKPTPNLRIGLINQLGLQGSGLMFLCILYKPEQRVHNRGD